MIFAKNLHIKIHCIYSPISYRYFIRHYAETHTSKILQLPFAGNNYTIIENRFDFHQLTMYNY